MSASFVSTVRVRPGVIRLGPPDAAVITVRVELHEAWDAVRIETPPAEPVLAVKVAALEAMHPRADHRDYVTKLRGFEVWDESQSLAEAGAVEGSIFLLHTRRRRPVR